MGVIPLDLEGPNPTVVVTKGAFDKAGGLEGCAVLIANADEDQFRDMKDSNVTYNLCVGDEYRDHRDVGKSYLRGDDAISLMPGQAVIIETREQVQFPRTMFGHIVPRVSLLQEGISNTASKVDPGYSGHLLITVFNLGKKTVTLARGAQFCCLYVLRVEQGARLYEKPGKRLDDETPRLWLRYVLDFIERNSAALVAVLIIIEIAREGPALFRAVWQMWNGP